jgi:dihydrofolate reductase
MKLIHITNTSLDGYVEDETGAFDWVNPDQVFGFITELVCMGGAELAGLALQADLVDECHLFLNPVIGGGGKPAFPPALRRNLELLDTHRFNTGVTHLHYRIRGSTA